MIKTNVFLILLIFRYVKSVPVGGTRGVTWSIDRVMQRHARTTWGVELIPRHFFFIFLLHV